MYQLSEVPGKGKEIPQVVFDRLSEAPENAVRVILKLIAIGPADEAALARQLDVGLDETRAALQFWMAAGIVVQTIPPHSGSTIPDASPSWRLTKAQVRAAKMEDTVLAGMLGEIEALYGKPQKEWQQSIFTELYLLDGYSADIILLAASHYYETKGINSARYIKQALASWRDAGISDCRQADEMLTLEAARLRHYGEMFELFCVASLSAGDKKRVDRWYEEYHYGREMVSAALLYVNTPPENIFAYVDGILRVWYAKGYTSPREVAAAGEGIPSGSYAPYLKQGNAGVQEGDIMETAVYTHDKKNPCT